MIKSEVVRKFAEKYGYTYTDSGNIVGQVIDFVTDELANGETLSIYGFMEFGTKQTNDRIGVNPITHEKITIKSKKKPYVKFGKSFKDKIANVR